MNFSADILPLVKEEVSRVAASAYDDGGNSLYDAIIIKSRDEATVERMYKDALSALMRRTADIMDYERDDEGEDVISYKVLDIDPDTLPVVADEITRYMSLNIVGAWLQERYVPASQGYVERGQLSLDKAVHLLKTRRAPRRTI